jgi:hypothetical protein
MAVRNTTPPSLDDNSDLRLSYNRLRDPFGRFAALSS